MFFPNINLIQSPLIPAAGSASYQRAEFHISALLGELAEAQREIIRLEFEIDCLNERIEKQDQTARGGLTHEG